jgi:DNA-binding NtrC family response regulator
VEAELFGTERSPSSGGSYKPGKFRLAEGGTLYFIDICNLGPALQGRLLNFLEEKVIYPAGSSKSYAADVRVIAATSKDIGRMAQEGKFSSGLYFRLNALSLNMPPLRERLDDLRLLMDHFLHARASFLNRKISGFSDACRRKLLEYDYPGNVLELKHIVEYAAGLCSGGRIELSDLPAYLIENPAGRDGGPAGEYLDGGAGVPDTQEGLDWASVERKMILDALTKAKGRRNKAALLLGWGRSTLWRKIRLYGIGGR